MRVLFLDIDGVLNSDPSRRGGKPTGGILGVDEDNLAVLQEIVRKSGAFVVITSTWKHRWGTPWQPGSMRYLMDKLRHYNIEIMGITTEAIPPERGKGIRRWLEYHGPVESWAVLDDDIFPDYPQQAILPRLVKTNFYRGGLTKDKVQPCVWLLTKAQGADIGCGTCPLQYKGDDIDTDTQVITSCTETRCPRRANRAETKEDGGKSE